MRRPFSGANRRSRISDRQGSLLPAGRVRRPQFPHLAFGPHPSRQWLRIPFFASGHMPKGRSVRRSAPRPGSATPATEEPNTKQRRKRQSRYCSRVRRPRFPHLAPRPHPSRQWLRIPFFAAGHMPKGRSVRRSAPRPGSATHGYKRSEYETTTQVSSLPDESMESELWWWISSNGATHTNPDGNALRLPQRGNAYLA
jgi:hypothetical protein